MKTAEELWQLIRRAEDLPYGAAQIALIEEALRHVDTIGDPDLAFTARIFATTAYVYGGEPVKAFATFSWCVGDFDRNPGPHHRRFAHNLLWDFKTMVSALTRFPEVPLARTYAVLDDMERRYREGGHQLQAVYKRRHLVARHLGLIDAEEEWFEKWQAAPRDDLSDCIGCDPTSVMVYLSSRGRYAEAVSVAEPVLAGELTCNEQPQNILTELMVPYLKVGRPADAVDAHRRAYRLHRTQLAHLSDIGFHISFCARTGNEHRGLEILQRHLDWLDKAPSPSAAMTFAASGGLLLRRITELGHGDATLHRRERGDIAAAELAVELAELATELGRRFDARNGTDRQGRIVAEELAAEPYGVDLVLSPVARQSPPPPPARPTPEPAPEIPAGIGAQELLDLARDLGRQDRDAAMGAVLTAFDERFPAVTDPLLAGRRARLRGDELRSRGNELSAADREAVIATWQEAADLLTAAGALGEASAVRARIALERAFAGEIDEAPIDADVAYQEEHGGARDRANSWARRAMVHVLRERFDEANAAGDKSDAYAAEVGDPRLLAVHATLRVRHRSAAGRHEDAAAAARAGWDFYREHGPDRQRAQVAALFGQFTDDPDEQLEAFGCALAGGLDGPALVARIGRGRALMRLDRGAEAIPDLVEAVAICAEQGLADGGAFVRQELANAYRLAGRTVEAAEVAEEAVLGFTGLGLDEPANDTRFLLAGLYRDLGDNDGALSLYRELIPRLADNPAGRGQIAELAGGLLFDMDRDAEAAGSFREAVDALGEAGDPIGQLRAVRRMLGAQHYADDVAGAEATIQLSDELWAELPAELAAEPNAIWQRTMTGFEAARLLMTRDRWAGAVVHLRGAPERLRSVGATLDGDRVECMLGEALLRSGERAEAEKILRELLDRLPVDSPTRETATRLHAEASTS